MRRPSDRPCARHHKAWPRSMTVWSQPFFIHMDQDSLYSFLCVWILGYWQPPKTYRLEASWDGYAQVHVQTTPTLFQRVGSNSTTHKCAAIPRNLAIWNLGDFFYFRSSNCSAAPQTCSKQSINVNLVAWVSNDGSDMSMAIVWPFLLCTQA